MQIDQVRYILAKPKKYGFDDCYAIVVPADSSNAAQLHAHVTLGKEALNPSFPYQECVGIWQLVSTGNRPDISYGISHAS